MASRIRFFKELAPKFHRLKDRILEIGLVKFLTRVFKEFGYDDGGTMAAGAAYYVFLSIFPLILLLIAIAGLFLPSQAVQEQLFSFFRSNIPGSEDVIQSNIQNIIRARGTLGTVGILGALWAGSGAVAAAARAINRAWDITTEMEFYLKKIRDIGLTLGLGILFILSLSAGAIFTLDFIRELPALGSVAVFIGSRVIAFLLSYAVFLILFKVVPNTRTYWRYTWFPALITAILFEIGRFLTFYYLTNLTDYEQVYGSVASVIVLLAWIYYSSIIVVLGAELTSEYGRMRRGISRGFPSHSVARP